MTSRTPGSGTAYSNAHALQRRGCHPACRIKVVRAGTTAEAVAAAQEAVGSADNPVVNVQVSGSSLVVTFADTTTQD